MSAPKPNQPRRIYDPIHDLPAHVENLYKPSATNASIKNIDAEFAFIEDRCCRLNIPNIEAEKPCNVEKNRWPDVLPPDSNRVVLNSIPDVEGSDYINASFIMSCTGDPKGYVCSQGPMDNTIDDWWRMCWDHKIKVFAMLTKEIEKNQVKSAKYWPEEKGVPTRYGYLEVTLVEKVEGDELVEREFKITNLKEPESERELLHFQYKGWPDHGLPPSTEKFLDLMRRVDQAIEQRGGPMGLHCSAGIGRTGTFCAVHINLIILREHFKTNFDPPPINLVNTVYLLRKQRPGMVQTKEQFLFCYRAILHEYKKMVEDAQKRKIAQQ